MPALDRIEIYLLNFNIFEPVLLYNELQIIRVKLSFLDVVDDSNCEARKCCDDRLVIRDGYGDEKTTLASLCGSPQHANMVYVSEASSIEIYFHSGNSMGGRGFSLSYTVSNKRRKFQQIPIDNDIN